MQDLIKNIKDIIIIGAGPAGLTAAVYALRAGRSVLVFERKSYGGQISQSHRIENYPSVKSISGSEYSMNLYNQAKDFGCEFAFGNVTKVIDGEIKTVITDSGEFKARVVIFALGAEPRKAGLENEAKLLGRGLSYCAVCDGNFFRNRDVMVVGGGNTALQDALYLSEICKTVYLLHRRDTFRAERALIKKVTDTENIVLIKNSVLVSAALDKMLTGVRVKNVITNDESDVAVNGLFLAIGQEPQTSAFSDLLPLDKYGYVKVDESCKVKDGIYVCGDCRQKNVRQLTTAVADGSVAATLASEYLDIKDALALETMEDF